MKTSFNTNNPVLPNNNNLDDDPLATPVDASDSSAQTDQAALADLLEKQGMNKDVYAQLSNLVDEAQNQGISVDDLLSIYPEFAANKDILNAMMQQQLNSARLSFAGPSTMNAPSGTDETQDPQLNKIMNLLTGLGPDASQNDIEESGLADLIAKLSPEQQSALSGILAPAKQPGDTKDLNPAHIADHVAPQSPQPSDESASSALLQTASEAYKKNDYDGAFKNYQAALKADPTLSERWPTIYYQLGVCSEYAKDAALNKGANDFYQQYLKSPNPDPKTAQWVQKESQWLTNKPQADKLIQGAQNQMYQEQDAPKAFSILKDTLAKFPELAQRQPDIYYTLATYAYSSANLSEAKKYLDLAKTAMKEQLKQDPGSKYAQYYMGQISDLMHQVTDPAADLSTALASILGNKLGGRKAWQELFSGGSNFWLNQGRKFSYTKNYWESKQIAAHYDSKTGYTGLVRMDTGMQKQEFDALSAQHNDAKTKVLAAEEKLQKLNEKLQKTADQIAKTSDAAKLEKLEKQSTELKQQISEAINQARSLAKISEVAEKNVEEFKKSFAGESYGKETVDRELKPIEQKELYRWDADVRASKQDAVYKEAAVDGDQQEVARLQNELKTSPENAATLKKALEKAEGQLAQSQAEYEKVQEHLKANIEGQEGFVAAAKQGEAQAVRYTAEAWKSTYTTDVQQRDTIQKDLADAVKGKKPKAEIKALSEKLALAETNVKASQTSLTEAQTHLGKLAAAATSALTPEQKAGLQAAKEKYGEVSEATATLIKEHDALVDEFNRVKADQKPTSEIETKLKANAEKMQKTVAEGKAAQEAYKSTTEDINRDIATRETTSKGNASKGTATVRESKVAGTDVSVRTGTIDDMSQMGPGWWGLGKTVDHQQAAAFQWHLGAGKDGKITSNWRGPFDSTSKDDATQDGVTIASGGKGLDKYNISANGGMNVGNVEHRDYEMVFGGTNAAGKGIGGMVGSQARADAIDEQFGINYSGSEATIGGEKIKNMVTMNASEQGAVGVQGDADISAGIGLKDGLNATLGAGAGGFAGAQAGGMAGGTVDGVGGTVMGQAWTGAGAKLNAHIGISHGKLNMDFGAGAAIGIGAYVDYNLTIDFNQIGQEIAGVGKDGVNVAKKWGDKVPGLGHVAGFIAGTIEGAGKLAVYTVDAISNAAGHLGDTMNKAERGIENLVGDKMHLGVVGKLGVRALASIDGETYAADMLSLGTTAKDSAKKSIGSNMVSATDDLLHGHFIKAAEETAVGIVAAPFKKETYINIFKHPGRTIKNAFKAIGHAFKKW